MAAKNTVKGIGASEGDAGGGAEVQRWNAGRKAAIVLDIIKCKSTPAGASRPMVSQAPTSSRGSTSLMRAARKGFAPRRVS
jgi:hypothetical protein